MDGQLEGYGKLKGKMQKMLDSNRAPDEEPLFFIQGQGKEVLFALPRRAIIIKYGILISGPFGSMITSFNYHDVVGIETVRLSGLMGAAYLRVVTPAMSAEIQPTVTPTAKYESDATRLPNCLAFTKGQLRDAEPWIARLRELVSDAKSAGNGATPKSIADDLERIAALHTSGVLTDAEFEAAKQRLLG